MLTPTPPLAGPPPHPPPQPESPGNAHAVRQQSLARDRLQAEVRGQPGREGGRAACACLPS